MTSWPGRGWEIHKRVVVVVGTGYYVECSLMRSRNKIKGVCLITQQWHDALPLMFPPVCQPKFLSLSLVVLSIHTEATILCANRLKSETKALHAETRNILEARYFYKKQPSPQSFLKVNNMSKHCKVDVYIDWLTLGIHWVHCFGLIYRIRISLVVYALCMYVCITYTFLRVFMHFLFIYFFFIIYSKYLKRVINKRDVCDYLK
jgi:hypothetical protein